MCVVYVCVCVCVGYEVKGPVVVSVCLVCGDGDNQMDTRRESEKKEKVKKVKEVEGRERG
jgi:hypothetical protein